MARRFFTIDRLAPMNTAGAWTKTYSGNLVTFVKTPAADTSVLSFEIPRDLHGSGIPSSGIYGFSLNYVVATASLSSAPTVTVNKVVIDPATRAISRTAVTNNLAFSGTNTVGTAAGTYTADVTFDPSLFDESNAFTFEFSFVAAATTALSTGGGEVLYNG